MFVTNQGDRCSLSCRILKQSANTTISLVEFQNLPQAGQATKCRSSCLAHEKAHDSGDRAEDLECQFGEIHPQFQEVKGENQMAELTQRELTWQVHRPSEHSERLWYHLTQSKGQQDPLLQIIFFRGTLFGVSGVSITWPTSYPLMLRLHANSTTISPITFMNAAEDGKDQKERLQAFLSECSEDPLKCQEIHKRSIERFGIDASSSNDSSWNPACLVSYVTDTLANLENLEFQVEDLHLSLKLHLSYLDDKLDKLDEQLRDAVKDAFL